MLPLNIDIASKGEYSIVGLGKVYFAFVAVLLWNGVEEGEFTSCSEGYAYGDVLIFGSFWIVGSVYDVVDG